MGLRNAGLYLEDFCFEKTVFGSFQSPAPIGKTYSLKNVTFDRCKVESGPMWFSHGWDLESVVIEKVDAWRIMISAETPVRGVKISSYAKAGRLEVLPSIATENLESRQFDVDGTQLDVSGYKGDLRIMGINADGVSIDEDRHYRLRLPNQRARASTFENLDQSSLIAITIDQMVGWRVRDGVFSLPAKDHKDFNMERKALEVLRNIGAAF